MATLAAFHLGGMAIDTVAVADAIEDAAERAPDTTLSAPLALVTAGHRSVLAHGLRWKLLESLAVGDPPIAGEHQFEPAAETCAVDDGNAGKRKIFDCVHDGLAGPGFLLSGCRIVNGFDFFDVRARNEDSAAGLLVRLELTHLDKSRALILSDSSWRVSDAEPAGWPGVI